MGVLSLRLPDDLEQQLSQEARLSGPSRSQLLPTALGQRLPSGGSPPAGSLLALLHGSAAVRLNGCVASAMGDLPCRVWLFGSRARGDWDGLSDTDLLVEADCAELAELAADKLRTALVGDDVLAWVEQLDQRPGCP